jgi:hypothetical protein
MAIVPVDPLLKVPLLGFMVILPLLWACEFMLNAMVAPEVFFRLICDPLQVPLLLQLTLPTLLLAARPPSDVVVLQLGVEVPLFEPVTPHPPPVHFWMRPLVSMTSAFEPKAVDGVQGPIVGAAVVILKLMTQPPCVLADEPHEVDPTLPNSQSVAPLVL